MRLSTIVRGFIGVAAVVTLLLPVDSLPDILPLAGWLDDILAAGYLVSEFFAFVKRRSSR